MDPDGIDCAHELGGGKAPEDRCQMHATVGHDSIEVLRLGQPPHDGLTVQRNRSHANSRAMHRGGPSPGTRPRPRSSSRLASAARSGHSGPGPRPPSTTNECSTNRPPRSGRTLRSAACTIVRSRVVAGVVVTTRPGARRRGSRTPLSAASSSACAPPHFTNTSALTLRPVAVITSITRAPRVLIIVTGSLTRTLVPRARARSNSNPAKSAASYQALSG